MMEIRFAKKEDLLQIIDLCEEHAQHEQVEYNSKNNAKLLSEFIFGHNPSIKCLVVAQENSIIGYATYMKQFSTWDAAFYIYLDCLFLKVNSRGQGIGKLLMEKIKECTKIEKCSSIQWQTPDFNQKAIDFYSKIGGIYKTKERFYLNI